jgi:hypothetical protein
MPKFSSGRITTNVIFYRGGVPNSAKNFGTYVSVNYEMLRQVSRYLRNQNGGPRELYKFF